MTGVAVPRQVPKPVREYQKDSCSLMSPEDEEKVLADWSALMRRQNPKMTKDPRPQSSQSYWYYDSKSTPVEPVIAVTGSGGAKSFKISNGQLLKVANALKQYGKEQLLVRALAGEKEGSAGDSDDIVHDAYINLSEEETDTDGEYSDEEPRLLSSISAGKNEECPRSPVAPQLLALGYFPADENGDADDEGGEEEEDGNGFREHIFGSEYNPAQRYEQGPSSSSSAAVPNPEVDDGDEIQGEVRHHDFQVGEHEKGLEVDRDLAFSEMTLDQVDREYREELQKQAKKSKLKSNKK